MTEEEVKNKCEALINKFEDSKNKIREHYHRIANNKIRILEKKKNENILHLKKKCLKKQKIEFDIHSDMHLVMSKLGACLVLEGYREPVLKKNNKEAFLKVTRSEIIRKGILSFSSVFIKNQILFAEKRVRNANSVCIKTELYEDDFLQVEKALSYLSPKQTKTNFFQSSCIVGMRYYVQKIKNPEVRKDLIKRIDAL